MQASLPSFCCRLQEAGRFTVDLKVPNGGAIYEGNPKEGAKAGVTLTLDDDNMVKLVGGSLNPQQVRNQAVSHSESSHSVQFQAFMSGKLKIKGNIMLTQKLQGLLKDASKL